MILACIFDFIGGCSVVLDVVVAVAVAVDVGVGVGVDVDVCLVLLDSLRAMTLKAQKVLPFGFSV